MNLQEITSNNLPAVLNQAGKDVSAYTPAESDREKVLFLGIDLQKDFMEYGSLPVKGSNADMERTLKWFYDNMAKISTTMVTMDTHLVHQVFHSAWWKTKDGKIVAPYTEITVKDLDSGLYVPQILPVHTRKYLEGLESSPSKKKLMIWEYHCINGTDGQTLESRFSNLIHYHSIVRMSNVLKKQKGFTPTEEHYGAIKPEFSPTNQIDNQFINILSKYNKIVVVGQAKSHCVLETLKQMVDYMPPEDVKNIYVLEDCMSSIQGFEQSTEDAFQELKNKYGLNLVKTDSFSL